MEKGSGERKSVRIPERSCRTARRERGGWKSEQWDLSNPRVRKPGTHSALGGCSVPIVSALFLRALARLGREARGPEGPTACRSRTSRSRRLGSRALEKGLARRALRLVVAYAAPLVLLSDSGLSLSALLRFRPHAHRGSSSGGSRPGSSPGPSTAFALVVVLREPSRVLSLRHELQWGVARNGRSGLCTARPDRGRAPTGASVIHEVQWRTGRENSGLDII